MANRFTQNMKFDGQAERKRGVDSFSFARRHLFSISLIGGVLLVCWIFLFRGMWVTVEFEAAASGYFTVYWQEEDRGFEGGKENTIGYQPGSHRVRIPIGSMPNGGKIRLDPMSRPGEVRILSFGIEGPFVRPEKHSFSEQGGSVSLRMEGDWVSHSFEDGNGLFLVSDGLDPQLVWEEVDWERRFWSEPLIWFLLLFVALVLWFERRYPLLADRFAGRLGFVPVCLLLATAGSLAIAVGSTRGIHPDEFVHLAAGGYYEDHWLVPSPDDPEARSSYSDYGASRLNTNEVAYWVAGKFSALIEGLGLESSHLRLRLFNVLLLGVITLCAVISVRCRFIALPILLTPQATYLFGYFNSDAFALALSFFLFFAITGTISPVGRIFSPRRLDRVFLSVLLGVALALPLGLLKPNFWLLGGFTLGYLSLRTLWLPAGRRMLPLATLGLMTTVPLAAHVGWDWVAEWKAGFQREKLMQQIRAETAKEIYSPNTPLEKLSPGLYLRERGYPLTYLFKERRWHEIAFASSFGNYGYFGVRPTPLFYERIRPALVWFCAALVIPAVFRLRRFEALVMAGVVLSCFAVVAAAVYHSWVNDFQAQGRYLAPILPMVGLLFYEIRRRISPVFSGIPVVALILMAFISLWLVAVPGLS